MQSDALTRRFLLRNPDGLSDEELLELLLQFCGEGSRLRAQALMEQYQSICAVLEAPTGDLAALPFLTQRDILLLRLVAQLHRRYFLSRSLNEVRLRNGDDFGRFLSPFFHGIRDEAVQLLCLDGAGRILSCKCISSGNANATGLPFRRLIHEALQVNASAVVLAHNHPSGIAMPSEEDIELTLRLQDLLDQVDVLLLDHIVVAENDYVSIRTSGYLND